VTLEPVTSATTFNPDNLAALLRYLPDGSFAAELVAALEPAPTIDEGRRLVAAALDARVKDVRAQLDAETTVA
jgi:hypothetical protein